VKKIFPFSSNSSVTGSYVVSSSVALSVPTASYVVSASKADSVLEPVSGSSAAINICIITYQQYLEILGGSRLERCE